METIKLSRKGFWYKYWSFLSFQSENPPITTCDLRWAFMWKTALTLLILPIFFIFIVLSKFSDNFEEAMQDCNLFYPVGLTLQFLGFIMTMAAINPPILIGYFFGPIFMAAAVLSSGLFLFISYILINWVLKTLRSFFPEKVKIVKKPSIIKILYLGWKDKLCSKITYID